MKRRHLEMLLQTVPPPSTPQVKWEQYITPVPVAANILHLAYSRGDLKDMKVADLGCGTGIFSIGALALGAREVIGLDIDQQVITEAEQALTGLTEVNRAGMRFVCQEINSFKEVCDTAIQNPPFGAQRKGADLPFLEAAVQSATVIYTMHLDVTNEFIRKQMGRLGCRITDEVVYRFVIPWTYPFHTKEMMEFNVRMYRLEKK